MNKDREVTNVQRRQPYQWRVKEWFVATFGKPPSEDCHNRAHRFLEEALELAQSLGMNEEQAQVLVKYVFSRPVGEGYQEVGGTMVTLAALCEAFDFNMYDEAERELKRVQEPEVMASIQAKVAQKAAAGTSGSPLPGQPPLLLLSPIVNGATFQKQQVTEATEAAALTWSDWPGPGEKPKSWWAVNPEGVSTKVYRSYEDYCDD